MISQETIDWAFDILEDPHAHGLHWTLQGFGMLRCYLTHDDTTRMHVWSREHQAPGICASYSDVHTHPWDFTSCILRGHMVNIRYRWRWSWVGNITRQLMKPGSGAHMLKEGTQGELIESRIDVLSPGDSYSQQFDEIHRSVPFTGCVSVIEREREDRPDEAYTFFLRSASTGWVSAAPRDATRAEVDTIIAGTDG